MAFPAFLDTNVAYLEIALEESADDPAAVPRALGVIARFAGTQNVRSCETPVTVPSGHAATVVHERPSGATRLDYMASGS
jgi:hypothetical protein